MADSRVLNFSAGPSALPQSVLEQAAHGLLNFNNTGIGISEISHRSKEFAAVLNSLEALIRDQLDVPSTHSILFSQGGGSAQFSAVVLNLLARHHLLHPDLPADQRALDYVVTGSWSKGAAEEAKRLTLGTHAHVNIAVDARPYSNDAKTFDNIPAHSDYAFSPDPALIYYCENETVHGVQFSDDPASPAAFPFHLLPKNTLVPLVADYSSSFMSRPIPHLADHAVIFAGAQKNLGPAGLTILIVRQDCIVDVDAAARLGALPVPALLSYKTLADAGSMPNTPAVLSIYISELVLQRSKSLGGVGYFRAVNQRKAAKMYRAVREGEEKGVFKGKVAEVAGSWMNVVFDVIGEGAEADFLLGAQEKGMKGLKGHRSVGGIRVSLYNAVTEEQTDKLIAYMKEFVAERSKSEDEDAFEVSS